MSRKTLKLFLSSSFLAAAISASSQTFANSTVNIPAGTSTTVTTTMPNTSYMGSGTLTIYNTNSTLPTVIKGIQMNSLTGGNGTVAIVGGNITISSSAGANNFIFTDNTGTGVLTINDVTADSTFIQNGGVVGTTNSNTTISGNYGMYAGPSSYPQIGLIPPATGGSISSYGITYTGLLTIGTATNGTDAGFSVYGNVNNTKDPIGQINLNTVDATNADVISVALGFFPSQQDVVPLSYQQDVSQGSYGNETFIASIQGVMSGNGDYNWVSRGGYIVLSFEDAQTIGGQVQANSYPTYIYDQNTQLITYLGLSTSDVLGGYISPNGKALKNITPRNFTSGNVIGFDTNNNTSLLIITSANSILSNGSGNSFFCFTYTPTTSGNNIYPITIDISPHQLTAWYSALGANGLDQNNSAASTMYTNLLNYANGTTSTNPYGGFNQTSQEIIQLGYNTIGNQVAYFNSEAQNSSQSTSNTALASSQTTGTAVTASQVASATSSSQTASVISTRQFATLDNEEGGVAAGDAAGNEYGLWLHATGGIATQKMDKGMPGYKSKSFGGVFGIDTRLSDSNTVGVVVSRVDSYLKHQDFKKGDKSKTTAYLLGVYGTHLFDNPWMVQGNMLVGKGYTSMRERHPINAQGRPTSSYSKYNNYLYSTEVMAGYRYHATDKLELRPMAGVQYHWSSKIKYNEDSIGRARKVVTAKGKHTMTGMLGGSVTWRHHIGENDKLHTSLHAFALHDFVNKAPKVKIVNSETGIAFVSNGAPRAANSYKVGADVTLEHGNMEYGVRYDADIAKKYIGHSGMLKLKLKL